MSFRVDLGTLRPAERLPDGRVRVEAHITRAGIFTYLNADGSLRRELRDPSEVFNSDSLASFAQLPVTNLHPNSGAVTADNARQHMVGANDSSVTRDDDHVRTMLMVADGATIKEMDSGAKVQVSCGYTCDYDPTPGEHPVFGKYDGKQSKIRGNHIALVPHARAGESARVRMDASLGDYGIMQGNISPINRAKGIDMPNAADVAKELHTDTILRADAAEKALDAAKAEIVALTTRCDTAEGKLLAASSELAATEGVEVIQMKLDEANAKVAQLETKLASETSLRMDAQDPKRMQDAVSERIRILAAVRAVPGGDRIAAENMTNDDLMSEVCSRTGTKIPTGSTSEYIKGVFDVKAARFDASARAHSQVGAAVFSEKPRTDTADDARKAMIERNMNAWQAKP